MSSVADMDEPQSAAKRSRKEEGQEEEEGEEEEEEEGEEEDDDEEDAGEDGDEGWNEHAWVEEVTALALDCFTNPTWEAWDALVATAERREIDLRKLLPSA